MNPSPRIHHKCLLTAAENLQAPINGYANSSAAKASPIPGLQVMKKLVAGIFLTVLLCSCGEMENFSIGFKNETTDVLTGVRISFENGKSYVCGGLLPTVNKTADFLPGPFEGDATVYWIKSDAGQTIEYSEKVTFDRSGGQNVFLITFTEQGLKTASELESGTL